MYKESLHGKGSGHHPKEDPMQVGNPRDQAWRTLMGHE